MSINGIGNTPVSSTPDVSALEHTGPTPQAAGGAVGNVLEQFAGGIGSIFSGGLGGIFESLGSIFGGGKSNSGNGFDLGTIISGLFDNPVFKLLDGLFGGGKKLDPVSAPPPEGQPLAQDAAGSIVGARVGATAEDEVSADESFDANAALQSGFSLADIDDIDNTPSSGEVANLAQLEGDK